MRRWASRPEYPCRPTSDFDNVPCGRLFHYGTGAWRASVWLLVSPRWATRLRPVEAANPAVVAEHDNRAAQT